VTLGPVTGAVRLIGEPRPRRFADFHVTADPVTLAALVAGAERRLARWRGPVRVRGRRRSAEALAEALRTADLSLAGAVRAGAAPPPELVFRAFAYAIDPAWTRGHRFSVAQHVTGDPPAISHIVVRDGLRVHVRRTPPTGGPDATVTMSPAAFAALLRGEMPAGGERPVVRGDRRAVAVLKAWTDRAQGLGA
ncbi:MAG TPA: hypothetical protein VN213_08700, partial [Solirubrobacteraceae bacterium]|nr:hypothetical protein [Solirubrobacteraceae bacterium]